MFPLRTWIAFGNESVTPTGSLCADSMASQVQERVPAATSPRRLYSCLFFKQDDAALALSVVHLLAYGLSFVPGLRELVVQALEQSGDARVHLTMEVQFRAVALILLQELWQSALRRPWYSSLTV